MDFAGMLLADFAPFVHGTKPAVNQLKGLLIGIGFAPEYIRD